jgi:hypothetical protein
MLGGAQRQASLKVPAAPGHVRTTLETLPALIRQPATTPVLPMVIQLPDVGTVGFQGTRERPSHPAAVARKRCSPGRRWRVVSLSYPAARPRLARPRSYLTQRIASWTCHGPTALDWATLAVAATKSLTWIPPRSRGSPRAFANSKTAFVPKKAGDPPTQTLSNRLGRSRPAVRPVWAGRFAFGRPPPQQLLNRAMAPLPSVRLCGSPGVGLPPTGSWGVRARPTCRHAAMTPAPSSKEVAVLAHRLLY